MEFAPALGGESADYLDKDVSLHTLAGETKNFSGAEIEGLVKSAASYAFARQVQVDNIKKVEIEKLKVRPRPRAPPPAAAPARAGARR